MSDPIPTSSPLSRDERETIIRWDDDEHVVTFFTSSPAIARKWTKLGHTLTPVGVVNGSPISWRGTAEVRAISLRGPKRRSTGGFQPGHKPTPNNRPKPTPPA